MLGMEVVVGGVPGCFKTHSVIALDNLQQVIQGSIRNFYLPIESARQLSRLEQPAEVVDVVLRRDTEFAIQLRQPEEPAVHRHAKLQTDENFVGQLWQPEQPGGLVHGKLQTVTALARQLWRFEQPEDTAIA